MFGNTVLPAPSASAIAQPIQTYLCDLHARLSGDMTGEVATYIPELGRADPKSFGISLATVDGTLYSVGDTNLPFTIQSMSKPFTYGRAVQILGRAGVLEKVGVEPTGEAFNSIVLDNVHNRPFNPMVNAGAIAVAALLSGDTAKERSTGMQQLLSDLAGRPLEVDQAVFLSERETGHRNRAIAYMMLNSGMITRDPADILDLYFEQCSYLVTCEDMALMAATLANHGTNPRTGQRVFEPEVVRDILTLMSTCGMYNYAGEWAYEVGIPAKSGVSGGIIAVIPGQLGVAVYSPPLDRHGNSIRGVKVCQSLSADFALHLFSDRTNVATVVRREVRGGVVMSKRVRAQAERAMLDAEGHRLALLEVQGGLYFGSAEILARRITTLAMGSTGLIIDFKRVNYADPSAEHLIAQTIAGLPAGLRVALTNLSPDGPLSRLYSVVQTKDLAEKVEFYEDSDRALEDYEDMLLANLARTGLPTKYALADLDILRGLPKDELKLLESAVNSFQFDKGEQIIRMGDEAKLFFVIARGSASVSITLADGQRRRVASVGPGYSFGEMAILDGGRRSADVFADEPMICYGFSVDRIHELAKDHPTLYSTILANMVKTLSDRLRRANDEIRALD